MNRALDFPVPADDTARIAIDDTLGIAVEASSPIARVCSGLSFFPSTLRSRIE